MLGGSSEYAQDQERNELDEAVAECATTWIDLTVKMASFHAAVFRYLGMLQGLAQTSLATHPAKPFGFRWAPEGRCADIAPEGSDLLRHCCR